MSPTAARIPAPPNVRNRWHRFDIARSLYLAEAMAEMSSVRPAKQCYHCQGIGHVQAACPTLRLAGSNPGVACYHCGQPGHLAVCSLARSSPGWRMAAAAHAGQRTCMNGGLPRVVQPVPVAPRGGYGVYRGGFAGRGGFATMPRTATCYKCGGPNHYARDCQAQAMKCYACGKLV